jgi:hypothetical protein
LEPNANLTVTLASVGYWFTHDGGTATVNISGSGRSTNNITCNYGVFKIGAGGTQTLATDCSLNINNISIYSSNAASYTATGNGVVIYANKSTTRIDNSIIALTTAGGVGVYQYVIWLNIGYLYVMGSTLEMSSQVILSGGVNGSTYGWLIFENGAVTTNDSGRIRIQNSNLSQLGAWGGGILTTPTGSSTSSVLVAHSYFYSANTTLKTYTFYNNVSAKPDKVYIGGSFVSAGIPPTDTTAGNGSPGSFFSQLPTSAQAMYQVANSVRPY